MFYSVLPLLHFILLTHKKIKTSKYNVYIVDRINKIIHSTYTTYIDIIPTCGDIYIYKENIR